MSSESSRSSSADSRRPPAPDRGVIYNTLVLIGVMQVLTVVFLLPWAMLALSAAYLLAGATDWTGPVILGVPSLASLGWLYRFSWSRLRRVPARNHQLFLLSVYTVKIFAPLAAAVIGFFIFHDLTGG